MLERIQRRASKMIKRMENGTSKERLRGSWWFSLKKRRLRGDLITACKHMTGYYKGDANNLFSRTREDRGNCLKLQSEEESKQANSATSGLSFWPALMTSREAGGFLSWEGTFCTNNQFSWIRDSPYWARGDGRATGRPPAVLSV